MLSLLICFTTVLCFSGAEVLQIITVDPATLEPGSRIIGGTPAAIERFPFTVQVLGGNQFRCGGTLLTRRHALSAAQCFVTPDNTVIEAEFFSVRAGSSFIHLDSDAQTRPVSKIVVHGYYNSSNHDSDLAVLLLNASVSFDVRVQPAVLPAQESNLPYGTLLTAVGWGQTLDVGVSEVLKQVLLQKVNTTECAYAYAQRANYTGNPYEVTTNMFCAGWPSFGGFDTCFGDNGGPLISTYNETQVVYGVTSWGPTGECGHPDYISVSVRLSNFVNWINNTVSVELAVDEDDGDEADDNNAAPSTHLFNSVVLVVTSLTTLVMF